MNNGIAIHDGNFGADWVNVTIDGKIICKIPYGEPNGTQRINAELVVKALNALRTDPAAISVVYPVGGASGDLIELSADVLASMRIDLAKK